MIVWILLLIFNSHRFLVNVSLAHVSVPILISHPATVTWICATASFAFVVVGFLKQRIGNHCPRGLFPAFAEGTATRKRNDITSSHVLGEDVQKGHHSPLLLRVRLNQFI